MDISPAELGRLVAAARRPLLVGPDAQRIRALLDDPAVPAAEVMDPRALLEIGRETFAREGADPSRLRPLYLRKSEAEIASGL